MPKKVWERNAREQSRLVLINGSGYPVSGVIGNGESMADWSTQAPSKWMGTSWPCGKAGPALPDLLISFVQVKLKI